jgi:hypothetical protein
MIRGRIPRLLFDTPIHAVTDRPSVRRGGDRCGFQQALIVRPTGRASRAEAGHLLPHPAVPALEQRLDCRFDASVSSPLPMPPKGPTAATFCRTLPRELSGFGTGNCRQTRPFQRSINVWSTVVVARSPTAQARIPPTARPLRKLRLLGWGCPPVSTPGRSSGRGMPTGGMADSPAATAGA